MKRITFIIVLLITVNISPLIAQILYLYNGEKIYCRTSKWNYTKNVVLVSIPDEKKKLKIPLDSIEKLMKGNVMQYHKPGALEGRENFMPRILEGKINVYKHIENSSQSKNGSQHSSSGKAVYLFMEKGNKYEQIFGGSFVGLDKNSNLEIMRAFMGDDPDVMKLLKNGIYKHRYENIIELARMYNVNTYKAEEVNNDPDLTEVCFFRYSGKQNIEAAQLQIGDQVISLSRNEAQMVTIPTGQSIKLCVNNGNEGSCDLISSSTDFLKYYKLSLNLVGEVEISNEPKSEFDTFSKSIRRYRLVHR